VVRLDDSSERTKRWLSSAELDRLERAAGSWDWEREIAMELLGRCGLHASEVPYPADEHLRWSEVGDVWLFEVRGKNTAGGGRKVRDAWMPEEVADDIHKFSRERDLTPSESWVSVSTPSVRRWVSDAAERVAEETGDDQGRWPPARTVPTSAAAIPRSSRLRSAYCVGVSTTSGCPIHPVESTDSAGTSSRRR
jgi:hypothetical protein